MSDREKLLEAIGLVERVDPDKFNIESFSACAVAHVDSVWRERYEGGLRVASSWSVAQESLERLGVSHYLIEITSLHNDLRESLGLGEERVITPAVWCETARAALAAVDER